MTYVIFKADARVVRFAPAREICKNGAQPQKCTNMVRQLAGRRAKKTPPGWAAFLFEVPGNRWAWWLLDSGQYGPLIVYVRLLFSLYGLPARSRWRDLWRNSHDQSKAT